MAKLIAIDLGHGVNTYPPSKGIRKGGKDYPEHSFNANLGVALDKRLKALGFDTLMYQKPNATDVSLRKRTDYYNAKNVDLVYSLHANASGDSAVNGRCVFYWHTSKESKKLADIIVAGIKKSGYSTHGNGLHASVPNNWANLHIVRETKMPAVLVENGFMTGDKDFDLVFGDKQAEYVEDMAKVHADSIAEYFGVSNVGKTPSKPKPKPKPSTKWTDKRGKWTGGTLLNGHYGEQVRQLQNRLATHKPPFYPNKSAKNNGVDGFYGADTEDAVRRYQSVSGLTVDGKAGKATYAKLNGVVSAKPKPTPKPSVKLPGGVLRQGSRGNSVKTLQRALNKAHFKVGKVDGIYGAKTTDAVRRFQLVHDAHNVDGIYGARTRSRLAKLI